MLNGLHRYSVRALYSADCTQVKQNRVFKIERDAKLEGLQTSG